MKKIRQLCCAAAIFSLGLVGFEARLQSAEFGANTPYYEDDAWYDITEWFDGNDYNPTDEAWWRWDDEKYEAAEDVSGDVDNDGWYGYTARNDNDWYYDYYDPYLYSYNDYDNNNLYEFGYRFYDYDHDGFYDAYASFTDSNDDGLYEDFDYYSFSDTGKDKQKQESKKSAARNSQQQKVSGQIQKMKLVKVRGGKQHTVVAIQPQQGQKDQMLVVDLGNTSDLKNINPKLGDKISAQGPKAQVGKKSIILARSFDLNGQTKQVNRTPRNFTGKVVDTHKTKIRGQEHLIAMVEVSQQGEAQKVAVDLGPVDRLKMNIDKGSNLTFSGFPVKVKGKPLVMAKSVQAGDQMVQINRQPTAMGGAQSSGSTDKGQGTQTQGAGGSEDSGKTDQPNRP